MINFNKKLIILLTISLFSFLSLFYFPTKAFGEDLDPMIAPGGDQYMGDPTTTPGGDQYMGDPTTTPGGDQYMVDSSTLTGGDQYMVDAFAGASGSSGICQAAEWDVFGGLQCFILDIFSAISMAMINISSNLLDKTINGDITGLGYSTSDNFIIAIGWGIVRNVANAALIIGLVWIAISIILGREDKAKDTLIKFILIALLINFTPVICSFIIDGSNIITNSFMSGGMNTNTYAAGIRSAYNSIAVSREAFLPKAALSIVLLIFSLFFCTILFLYSLLFIARIIILWILVIVSPVAFATKVFPKFEHIGKIFPSILSWNEWWGSFWQWCFIGIPAGLSIYLANKLITAYSSISAEKMQAMTSLTLDNLLGFLFSYLLPFAFLLVGFFMTISTGEKAASKLSGEITGFTKKAAGWAGAAGLGVAAGGAGAAAGYLSPQEGLSRAESAKAGFAAGKYTMEKEGIVGSSMLVGGKMVGAGIGVAGGIAKAGKNWAIRASGFEDEVKQNDKTKVLEEIQHIKGRKDLTLDEQKERIGIAAERYNQKIKSYDMSAGETIIAETKKGLNSGGVNAASDLIGGAGGGTIAAALGVIKEASESARVGGSLTDIKDAMKKGIATGGAIGSDVGKEIADVTIGAAGRIAVDGIKKGTSEVFKKMSEKVTEPQKEKKQTKEEWEEEAKEK